MQKIWENYQKIEEIESKSKIKTYKVKLEPIIKEIVPEDRNDYYIIKEKLEKINKKYKLIDIIEENNKFYIVMYNDDELINKIDQLILSDELNIENEGKIDGHGNTISKNEILNLFQMEKSIIKIQFESIQDGKLTISHGTGFLCEIEGNFPIKYALFTNNHILNETNIELNRIIKFQSFESKLFWNSNTLAEKNIVISNNRKAITNKKLDYTCIEILESDGFKNFFKIEPNIITHRSNKGKIFLTKDIFILQFHKENEITFSDGNIIDINDNEFYHTASTEYGSSGSPIIKRDINCKDNYIIGLHKATVKKHNKIYNIATTFDSILNNIKEQINEINCIYIPDKNNDEINLLYYYNKDINEFKNEELKQKYLEEKNINRKIFEDNIDIYINDRKIRFNYKYKFNIPKEIKVKFKFKQQLTNMGFMFYGCSSLKSIDLSSFNSSDINNMCFTFCECSSLNSLDLSSFDSSNVKDIQSMFNKCSSLISLNLSSFDTINVNNMSFLFSGCSSLENINISHFITDKVKVMNCMFKDCSKLNSLDLLSFNTRNVINMENMFYGCSSLKALDISSFDTINVKNMAQMFFKCSSLKNINLYYFNTKNVIDMKGMFNNCSSLKTLDLSSFDTKNVCDMQFMFHKCYSLISLNLSLFDTSNINNMSSLFSECSSLKNINISHFITDKVNDMSCMFKNCSSIKSLDLSSFNTGNVTNMHHMFFECSSLENIILSNFITNKVIDMQYMFFKCSSLKSLDLSSFETNNVINMTCIFYGCFNLESLNLSLFNTSKVNNSNMWFVFNYCEHLKKKNIIIKNKNDNIIKAFEPDPLYNLFDIE